MNQHEKSIIAQPQTDTTFKKQMRLYVDGCNVKLSFAPQRNSSNIEQIKKMILSGMARV